MKMTVVTTDDGSIVAAHQGEVEQPDTETAISLTGWQAGLLAGPGQKLSVVDVPDTILNITDPGEFETQLKSTVAKRK